MSDQMSGQDFYDGELGSTGISYIKKEQYGFYDSKLSENGQVQGYYNRDSNEFRSYGYNNKLIETNEKDTYIIWMSGNDRFEKMMLYTSEGEYFISYTINSNEMSDLEKIEFLKNLFEINTLEEN